MQEKKQNMFKSDLITRLGQKQTAVKFKMYSKDENVQNVLTTDVTPLIANYQSLSGEVTYGGKVVTKLVTVEENGTITGLSYTVDFTDEFKNESITTDSVLDINLSVIDIVTEFEGTEIIVNAVIEADITLYKREENTYIESGNFISKNCEVKFGATSAYVDETFTVGNEMEIKDSIAKVLLSKSEAVLNAASVTEGVLTVDGEVFLALTYLSTDNNAVKNALFSFPFTQELAVQGDGAANLTAKVKMTKIHLDVLEDSKTSLFNAEVTLAVKGIITNMQIVNALTDAYSLTNETANTYCSVTSTLSKGLFGSLQTVNGIVETSLADAVFSGTAGLTVNIIEVASLAGGITVKGTVAGTIYFTKGEQEVGSEKFEIPFTLQIETPLADLLTFASLYGAVKQIAIENNGGKLDIDCDILFTVNLMQNMTESFIADVAEGEAIEDTLGAIEVCIAKKGDSVWEVAKNLRMSEEDLLKLNPDLTDPLTKDEKLIIYHQRTA